MLANLVTFEFDQMLVTHASAKFSVLDGFVHFFLEISDENLPPFLVQQAPVQFLVEMLLLYFLLVQYLEDDSVNDDRFEDFGYV